MGAFNTVGLEAIIESFSKREQATVFAVPKMLKAGADVLVEAQRAEARAMGIVETAGFVNSITTAGNRLYMTMQRRRARLSEIWICSLIFYGRNCRGTSLLWKS